MTCSRILVDGKPCFTKKTIIRFAVRRGCNFEPNFAMQVNLNFDVHNINSVVRVYVLGYNINTSDPNERASV